jgi:hypothetical protein
MAYKITIRSLGEDNQDYVNAYVPEEFILNMEHSWENPFETNMSAMVQTAAQFASGGELSAVFDPSVVGDAVGMSTFTYRGTSPLQLAIELEFVINDDLENDLRVPIKKLVNMSCPKTASKETLSTLGVPDMVQVSIPGVLDIKKAFILNVGVNMMKPLVTNGSRTLPLRARVPVTFASAYITTTDRLEYTLFP